MASNPFSEILHRIIADAEKIKSITHKTQLPITVCSIAPPTLHLEFPHDIITSIDDLNLSPESRERLKQLTRQKVLESQRKVSQIYERVCRSIPNVPHASTMLDHVAKIHQQTYENGYLSRFREEICKVRKKIEHSTKFNSRTKAVFKPEYTPQLETYFENNAYPSSQDRLVLARKTKMTARQIEVWFQNHRNRAKKEGKPLKRWSPHHFIDPSMASLDQKSTFHNLPVRQRLTTPPDDILDLNPAIKHQEISTSKDSNMFPISSNSRPSHAFPTPYPPATVADPFPNKDGVFTFPAPVWRRHPASTTSFNSIIDMDELVMLFSVKLNIRQNSSKAPKISKAEEANLTPWFSATVTVPFPAPHPAFLRSSIPQFSTQISNIIKFGYGNWQSTSPLRPPPSFPSWQLASYVSAKPRKLAAIPKRTPPKIFSRMADPPLFQTSSRSTSLASISSSGSQSSTFSLDSSPEPMTPPLSPNLNAHDIQSLMPSDEDLDSFASFFSATPDLQYSPHHDFLDNQVPEKESLSSLYGNPSMFPPIFDLLSYS